jgi:hypothetical protein
VLGAHSRTRITHSLTPEDDAVTPVTPVLGFVPIYGEISKKPVQGVTRVTPSPRGRARIAPSPSSALA